MKNVVTHVRLWIFLHQKQNDVVFETTHHQHKIRLTGLVVHLTRRDGVFVSLAFTHILHLSLLILNFGYIVYLIIFFGFIA